MSMDKEQKEEKQNDKTKKIFNNEFQKSQEKNAELDKSRTHVVGEIDPRPIHNPKIKRRIITGKVERTQAESTGVPKRRKDPTPNTYSDRFNEQESKPMSSEQEQKTGEVLQTTAKTIPVGMPSSDETKKNNAIEKPGIVLKNEGRFIHTADLSPMPTIVSADEELASLENSDTAKKRVARLKAIAVSGNDNFDDEDDNEYPEQLMLQGFAVNAEVEKVDDQEAEASLKQVRSERAKNFKLFGENEWDTIGDEEVSLDETLENASGENIDKANEKKANRLGLLSIMGSLNNKKKPAKSTKKENTLVSTIEYRAEKDKRRIASYLELLKTKRLIKTLAVLIIGIILLLISLIPAIAYSSSGTYGFAAFGGNPTSYLLLHLFLMIIAGVFSFSELTDGLRSIMARRFSLNFGVFIVFVAAIIQTVLLLFFSDALFREVQPYSACAVMLCVPLLWSRYLCVENKRLGLNVLTEKKDSLCSIETLKENTAYSEISKLIHLDNPEILYSQKTKFISSLIQQIKNEDFSWGFSALLMPIVVGLSVFIGALAAILSRSFIIGYSAFAGVLCLGIPVATSVAAAVLTKVNLKGAPSNSFVTDFTTAKKIAETDAIILDATDILGGDGCNIYGIKTFNSMKIDDAILYTAAMIVKSGGPLSGIFDKVILEKRELLPPVESLSYEDKLGLSAWIHNQRVLVGNRDLLNNHSVLTPDSEFEKKYTHDGRQIIYLAVEGKLSAMFVVSYSSVPEVLSGAKELSRRGITLFVRTIDANITEEFIESRFNLSPNTVKVIPATVGEYYRVCRETLVESIDAAAIHTDNVLSFFRTLRAAFILNDASKIISPIITTGALAGVVLMLLVSVLSNLKQAGSIQLILFQAFWFFGALLISQIKCLK